MHNLKQQERRTLANESFAQAQRWAATAAAHQQDDVSEYERAIADAAISRAYSEIANTVASSLDFAAGYDTAMRDIAAGMGLDIAFVQERANVGSERIKDAGGDVDLAIERAVRGE